MNTEFFNKYVRETYKDQTFLLASRMKNAIINKSGTLETYKSHFIRYSKFSPWEKMFIDTWLIITLSATIITYPV